MRLNKNLMKLGTFAFVLTAVMSSSVMAFAQTDGDVRSSTVTCSVEGVINQAEGTTAYSLTNETGNLTCKLDSVNTMEVKFDEETGKTMVSTDGGETWQEVQLENGMAQLNIDGNQAMFNICAEGIENSQSEEGVVTVTFCHNKEDVVNMDKVEE